MFKTFILDIRLLFVMHHQERLSRPSGAAFAALLIEIHKAAVGRHSSDGDAQILFLAAVAEENG